MTVGIQGNFCGSSGLSDPVYGSGGGHPKFFLYFPAEPWKSVLKKGALFVMHPLVVGENKIVQNADKIVHCELAVMHLYLYM